MLMDIATSSLLALLPSLFIHVCMYACMHVLCTYVYMYVGDIIYECVTEGVWQNRVESEVLQYNCANTTTDGGVCASHIHTSHITV
jgi:hypothetical protein